MSGWKLGFKKLRKGVVFFHNCQICGSENAPFGLKCNNINLALADSRIKNRAQDAIKRNLERLGVWYCYYCYKELEK